MSKSNEIRDFIFDNVGEYPDSISREACEKYRISRQAVNRYLRDLTNQGLLIESGKTRNKRYELKTITEKLFPVVISPDYDEDTVWRKYLAALLKGFRQNTVGMCHYGFTEMYNNVLDHSGGKKALIMFKHMPGRIELEVTDDGIGIFNKIAKELGIADKRQAILELSKGKFTTDPEYHTGEGIFFTSRMFDKYSILSGEYYFYHGIHGDWLIEDAKDEFKGTNIKMVLRTNVNRTVKEVFDEYSGEAHDYGFRRTHVPLSLVTYGDENLVSRSQAKRVLARFDDFDEVLLDFLGVEFIGQAFADEIFRVYKNNNPNKKLLRINANPNIEQTIEKSLALSK